MAERNMSTQSSSELRRLIVAAVVGVAVAVVVSWFVRVELAVLVVWDATALVFLASVWPTIASVDGAQTEQLATREDLSREIARLVLLVASSASVVAVVLAISRARHEVGADKWTLVGIAAVTVVVSWTAVNTVFLLRYADLYYGTSPGGVDFASVVQHDQPDYRDFAYLAFTIGMCYQVSDTTLRARSVRRTVITHALMSYVFGVVIIATGVNIVAGLG
jgi:uncharacterized membrane protein